MAILQATSGRALAIFVDDFFPEDITNAAFDPIGTLHDSEHVHPTVMTEPHCEGLYAKNGFLVRPDADGELYVITWRQYQEAVKAGMTIAEKRVVLAALEPKKFNGLAGNWVECAVVKVYGTDGDGTGHSESVATGVEIGIIL